MKLSRLDVLLLQVRDAASDLDVILLGVDRKALDHDVTKRMAVAMSLLIISDLVGRIQAKSPEFFTAHPEIRWNEIRAFRNRLAHDYFNLDLDIVWETATVSVTELMASLAPYIPPQPQSGS